MTAVVTVDAPGHGKAGTRFALTKAEKVKRAHTLESGEKEDLLRGAARVQLVLRSPGSQRL